MRGFALICLSRSAQLDSNILPYVREQLEFGIHAYPLGAAAVWLQKCEPPPKGWSTLVESAIRRILKSDEPIQLKSQRVRTS